MIRAQLLRTVVLQLVWLGGARGGVSVTDVYAQPDGGNPEEVRRVCTEPCLSGSGRPGQEDAPGRGAIHLLEEFPILDGPLDDLLQPAAPVLGAKGSAAGQDFRPR